MPFHWSLKNSDSWLALNIESQICVVTQTVKIHLTFGYLALFCHVGDKDTFKFITVVYLCVCILYMCGHMWHRELWSVFWASITTWPCCKCHVLDTCFEDRDAIWSGLWRDAEADTIENYSLCNEALKRLVSCNSESKASVSMETPKGAIIIDMEVGGEPARPVREAGCTTGKAGEARILAIWNTMVTW